MRYSSFAHHVPIYTPFCLRACADIPRESFLFRSHFLRCFSFPFCLGAPPRGSKLASFAFARARSSSPRTYYGNTVARKSACACFPLRLLDNSSSFFNLLTVLFIFCSFRGGDFVADYFAQRDGPLFFFFFIVCNERLNYYAIEYGTKLFLQE